MKGAEVYIGLGSNLGDPRANLRAGLRGLGGLAGYEPLGLSSPYVTAPVGPVEQPPFWNAVARGRWRAGALDLLAGLLALEAAQGRVRKERWGPRTLDLDLLLFGDEVIDLPQLQTPHPRMRGRAFVLVPLAELAPELVLPRWGKTAAGLLAALPGAERRSQKVEKAAWE